MNLSSAESGWPLYHETKSVAEKLAGRSSPGIPNRRSIAAPFEVGQDRLAVPELLSSSAEAQTVHAAAETSAAVTAIMRQTSQTNLIHEIGRPSRAAQ
jgi:hypothetical protein